MSLASLNSSEISVRNELSCGVVKRSYLSIEIEKKDIRKVVCQASRLEAGTAKVETVAAESAMMNGEQDTSNTAFFNKT